MYSCELGISIMSAISYRNENYIACFGEKSVPKASKVMSRLTFCILDDGSSHRRDQEIWCNYNTKWRWEI